MQRAHHPHTSIHGKSVPYLGQCLSFFAWMQQDPYAGVDELITVNEIMNTKAYAFRLEGIVADTLSD